ncbi:hypothetical protein B9Z55_007686 [Caenorhabditis nigoni]|nr:hypothetical protein B9Z55_007686 [Caenorhabditis nigoni]
MWFDQTDYHINDKRYEIKEFVRLLNETPSPGDILSGSPLKYEKRILKFLIGKEYVEELPEGLKLHEARKRLVCALLGGRPTIHVQKLDIDFYFVKVLRIPEGVKFKTTEVSVSGSIGDLRLFLPIIHPESFPLKVLRVWVTDPSMLDIPEVRSAQELEIHFNDDSNYNKLHNLPNRTIRVVDYDMPQEAIIGLIDNWVDFGKDVGSTFTTECGPLNHLVSDVLKEAEEMFGGRKVELVEKDER